MVRAGVACNRRSSINAADLAQVDIEGRLHIFEPSSPASQDCDSNLALKPDTANKRVQTHKHQQTPDNINVAPPLQRWLDYYQVKSSFHAALDKLDPPSLQVGRQASQLGVDSNPQAAEGYLHNSRCWLERFADSLSLLHEIRDDHKAFGSNAVGRQPESLVAEWAGSETIDILADVFENLVDQIALYEESFAALQKRESQEAELRAEVDRVSAALKTETTQRLFYWRKLKERQQLNSAQKMMGSAASLESADDDDDDSEVPIYTERQMRAVKQQWMQRLEELEQDLAERLEKEKQRARATEDELKAKIRELEAQLASLQQKRSLAHPDEKNLTERTGPRPPGPPPPRRKAPSSSSGGDDDKARARGKHGTKKTGPAYLSTDDSDRPTNHSRLPTPTSGTSLPQDSEALATLGDRQVARSRPGTAGRGRPEDVQWQFKARSWDPSPSEYETRRLAEELKRRVFEEVLEDERRRQAQADDEDAEQIAARWTVQGYGDLVHLLRRVDDLALRRDLFKELKSYHKRMPTVLEIVCVYCRRKAKPDQIHSFDPQCPRQPCATRPSSAARAPRPGSATSDSYRMASAAALPQVASSPGLMIGWQNTATAAGSQESKTKLHMVMPLAPGKTPSPSTGLAAMSSQHRGSQQRGVSPDYLPVHADC